MGRQTWRGAKCPGIKQNTRKFLVNTRINRYLFIVLRHVVTYSTRHCCSSFGGVSSPHSLTHCCSSSPKLSIAPAAAAASALLLAKARAGFGKGSPARLRQSGQQPGSCPTPQCLEWAAGTAHLSALVLFSTSSPQLPLPAALQAGWGGPAGISRCPVPKPAHSAPFFLVPWQAGGDRKCQSSCSQLLRHIWIAMHASLLFLLLLLFTLCRHVGFSMSSFPRLSTYNTHHVFSLFVCHP